MAAGAAGVAASTTASSSSSRKLGRLGSAVVSLGSAVVVRLGTVVVNDSSACVIEECWSAIESIRIKVKGHASMTCWASLPSAPIHLVLELLGILTCR